MILLVSLHCRPLHLFLLQKGSLHLLLQPQRDTSPSRALRLPALQFRCTCCCRPSKGSILSSENTFSRNGTVQQSLTYPLTDFTVFKSLQPKRARIVTRATHPHAAPPLPWRHATPIENGALLLEIARWTPSWKGHSLRSLKPLAGFAWASPPSNTGNNSIEYVIDLIIDFSGGNLTESSKDRTVFLICKIY